MTFPLPPAKVQAYADTNGVRPAGRLFSDFEAQVICDHAAGRTPCTPPAQPEPARVPPTDSALGESFTPYVFTWSNEEGPMVERFEEFSHLQAFSRGWCDAGGLVSVVSANEFRGTSS